MQNIIKKTKDLEYSVSVQKEQNVDLNNKLYKLNAEIENKDDLLQSLESEIVEWKKRETLLKSRELIIHQKDQESAVHFNIAQTYEKIVNLMFKNTTIRESIIENSPTVLTNHYNNGTNGSNSCQIIQPTTKTIETTKERQ
jgi:biopolymer transport protein ExbB/TolQ